jgi:hypothetical protein
MLFFILCIFLLLSLGGGAWGHSRYGYSGWSPAGIILLVLLVLWLTGNLHIGTSRYFGSTDTPMSDVRPTTLSVR